MRASRRGNPSAELATKYTAEYHECLGLLGIDSIDRFRKRRAHWRDYCDVHAAIEKDMHTQSMGMFY